MNAGRAYYNEHDPFAAAWLRELVAAGLVPAGDVDERDIRDVLPSDLDGYTACHFFAGIGGWALALDLAGWPRERAVWTGSCPCQPFSAAGRGGGFADERHLWPAFFHLIGECQPATMFGEQVASATDWLALVHRDLEALGYAVGAIPMEAASAGADHFRDRYWFVADVPSVRGLKGQPHTVDTGWATSGLAFAAGDCAVVNAAGLGWGEGWSEHELRSRGLSAAVASVDGGQYLECPDGKWRRLPPPGVRWLGARIPARVDILRGLGNAIDPRPAAEFIFATGVLT